MTACALQARAQVAIALAGVSAAALALGAWLSLHGAFALKASLIGAASLLLAWPWLRARGPGFSLGVASQVTLLRAAMVVLIAAMLHEAYAPDMAFTVLVLASGAALLDGVDGWLARRSGTVTAVGARFDMETDAALIAVLSVLAWQWDKAGAWVLLAGLARYAFVAAARAWPWLRRPLPPRRRRRVICVVLTAALIACLAPVIAHPMSALIAGSGLAALAVSFALDIRWLARNRGALLTQPP